MLTGVPGTTALFYTGCNKKIELIFVNARVGYSMIKQVTPD